MTGGGVPVAAAIASYRSVCCGRPMSSGVTLARLLMYDETTSAGSRISSRFVSAGIHSRGVAGSRWCAMCFWYQIGLPPGTGPSSEATTLRTSVSPAAITSSRAGMIDSRGGEERRVQRLVASPRNRRDSPRRASSPSRCCAARSTSRCAAARSSPLAHSEHSSSCAATSRSTSSQIKLLHPLDHRPAAARDLAAVDRPSPARCRRTCR